eukprot:CAMPEP_0116836202 /NCGR_PEP_ID=MMETSP0418-20121206/7964_1 /TAXON_ID=1158023 /ORGANISM="Astrosyne radiata, Strain 13vi08-1A" /LENGTH=234 /DNA_ID=CAMNT_0004465943 /DNA_START=84 /DNA_END=788 /DNA_ORIENTATION=-
MKRAVVVVVVTAAAVVCMGSSTMAFTIQPQIRSYTTRLFAEESPIVSPFDSSGDSSRAFAPEAEQLGDEPLELTIINVEKVLDEMRPYLIQDGGNVAVAEIDGPVVYLELQGACGTCPSSTMTMKMGLERRLKEVIPEIQEVVQMMPESPELTEEQCNVVLDGVRPFLQVAGGSISVSEITGVGSLQPMVYLKMDGPSASLNSVKMEIVQRLQRHFMISGLQIHWDESGAGDDW